MVKIFLYPLRYARPPYRGTVKKRRAYRWVCPPYVISFIGMGCFTHSVVVDYSSKLTWLELRISNLRTALQLLVLFTYNHFREIQLFRKLFRIKCYTPT